MPGVARPRQYTEQITSAGLVHKQQPHAATYNKKHDNNHRPDGNDDVTQSQRYASMLSFLSLSLAIHLPFSDFISMSLDATLHRCWHAVMWWLINGQFSWPSGAPGLCIWMLDTPANCKVITSGTNWSVNNYSNLSTLLKQRLYYIQ